MIPLPIDPFLPAIQAAVRKHRAAVVVASPGAGKTTRVPPVLALDGPLILLQPRRMAARLLARRIAEEQGWTLGEEVGWQVRFERRFSKRTRLLVATEGILTARLQEDPLLAAFRTIVLDEFHERSVHGDLALALARQAQRARDDLAIVVMSATLEAAPVAAFLGGCPVIEVPGRLHPVTVLHRPGVSVADAARETVLTSAGHLLCFLPGAAEIGRAARELSGLTAQGIEIHPLHGSLPMDEQDAALRPSSGRKIILATNLAETSLTVEGVRTVVDTGLQRVLRYDQSTALDRLETERIAKDSAEQRAGRAGRTGPGTVLRLWDPRQLLRARREPELLRVDLAAPLLDVIAWGGDPATFEWFEAPPQDAVERALTLLRELGALEGRRLSAIGEAMRRIPLPPRLARVFVASGGTRRAAIVCAALADGRRGDAGRASPVDVLALVDDPSRLSQGIREAVRQLVDAGRALNDPAPRSDDEETLLRALLAGYPDRVARRRAPGDPRLLLASGHGAVLAAEGTLGTAEFVVALDLRAGDRGPGAEARVTQASRLERTWLLATHRDVAHRFDAAAGRVRAWETVWYRQLPLEERAVAPDPERAGELLAGELERRLSESPEGALVRRLRFAGLGMETTALLGRACAGCISLAEVDLERALSHAERQALARDAPERLTVPSGRDVRLDYREDGTVAAEVKLQELFGLAETPRIGPRREPVLLLLLAPSGRPVQTTRDLRSFWDRTYPEVRKELRGRYPRHPWPEDPWNAVPTARTKKKAP